MYKILKAEKLNEIVYLMVVEAPMVAKHCQPGQFIIVKLDDAGERVPLTICDYDREARTVTIVFQPIRASTEKIAKLQIENLFGQMIFRTDDLCYTKTQMVRKSIFVRRRNL